MLASYVSFFKKAFSQWMEDNVSRLAAALAYYSILSMAPLVVLAVTIAGLAFSKEVASGAILEQARSLIGPEGANTIQSVLEHAQKPGAGAIAGALAIVTLLFGASGVFGELRGSLNLIWHVKTPDSGGLFGMIRQQFFSFGMVLAIGFLLLISLVLSAGIAAAGKVMGGWLPLPEPVLQIGNQLFSFLIIAGLFMLIFKYVPNAAIEWRDVWVGGFVTAFLFTIGKTLIGLYLGKASVGSTYGAAGSLVVMLVWVYYSAQIFFLGAEFTRVYAHAHGSRLNQAKDIPQVETIRESPKEIPLERRPAVGALASLLGAVLIAGRALKGKRR